MKAVIHTKYGPPEVAQVLEVAKPIPNDHEILVKVFASTVNWTDCGIRSAPECLAVPIQHIPTFRILESIAINTSRAYENNTDLHHCHTLFNQPYFLPDTLLRT